MIGMCTTRGKRELGEAVAIAGEAGQSRGRGRSNSSAKFRPHFSYQLLGNVKMYK